jgi:hypothetical protein
MMARTCSYMFSSLASQHIHISSVDCEEKSGIIILTTVKGAGNGV